MKDFTNERFPSYVSAWDKIAWFKEFPHLSRTSCYYLINFFNYNYDFNNHDIGVFKLQFSDGSFVITSSKTSFRRRISEIVSNAVTFLEDRRRTPLETSVGVRLYKREMIQVFKLSDNPSDKKEIQKKIYNGTTKENSSI